jgi:hypothetical protein
VDVEAALEGDWLTFRHGGAHFRRRTSGP